MFVDELIQGIVKDSLALDEDALMENTRKIMKTLRRYSKPVPTGSESYEPLSYMSWLCGAPVDIELADELGESICETTIEL